MVTPTYYVFFTSAVIVSSAVLFQGFKGTAIQIITVVLGFLQICSGVVLLQLSKSAKDVPDTAVFAGDLDQVRTVAEQEEPEYEPRADTIRGSAAILRSFSTARQKRQMQEVEQLREEHLNPIGEDEQVQFDGLRRRRTIIQSDNNRGSLARRQTIHPPLGMSRFPDAADEEDGEGDGFHPGIFHFKRKNTPRNSHAEHESSLPMSPIKNLQSDQPEEEPKSGQKAPHIYGLPPGLQRRGTDVDPKTGTNTSTQHIQFADGARSQPNLATGTLSPPTIPPTPGSGRQFSFHNVFQRSPGSHGESTFPTLSRSGLSFSSRKSSSNSRGGLHGNTEEERLGLVKGDSHNSNTMVPNYSNSPPDYEDHLDPNYDWNADDADHSRSQPEGRPRTLTGDRQRPQESIDLDRSEHKSDDEPKKDGSGSPTRPSGKGPGGAGFI